MTEWFWFRIKKGPWFVLPVYDGKVQLPEFQRPEDVDYYGPIREPSENDLKNDWEKENVRRVQEENKPT